MGSIRTFLTWMVVFGSLTVARAQVSATNASQAFDQTRLPNPTPFTIVTNSLLYDYTNNISPTRITFSGVNVENNYVSTTPATVQLKVTGLPYYIAVSVDDANFMADAVWTNYTGANITVPLGSTPGWHDIWIGLRGHGDAASAAVWQ